MNKADIAIIGSNPAGFSDKVQRSECISNYPALIEYSIAAFTNPWNKG